jgi:hypothetical protein
MSACIQCGSVVENSVITGVVCLKCSNNMTGIDKPPPKVDPLMQGALAAGVVPFVFSLNVNGRNLVALLMGALMLVLSLVALVRIKSAPKEVRKFQLAATIVVILVGLYHVVRNLG